ncbi:MAG: GAP family protein [Gemmatimonadota bacterium]|nr:MAG: GAP family protein [Gemmatimonadota bacterium]
MIALLYALTPISLIDSLSLLPFAAVALAVLLSGPKPYVSSISFLFGILLSYFASGILIVFGLSEILRRVTEAIVHWFNNPRAIDYILSMIVGVALILLGYRWAIARRKRAERKEVSAGMTPGAAFLMGAGATIAGIWGALPYFAAIDQIMKADVSFVEGLVALGYYNIVFVSLATALVVTRAVMGQSADIVFETVNRLFEVWGKRVLVALMIVLGSVMLADGVGWMFGHPVIPVG